MSQTGKWGTFWILVIGIVVGILCTAGLVGVVQWAGTDKFCTGWCHSMDGVSYAWKQGQHARTPSGYTAGCSDCHLLNETNRPLTPVAYVELLFEKLKPVLSPVSANFAAHSTHRRCGLKSAPSSPRTLPTGWFLTTSATAAAATT